MVDVVGAQAGQARLETATDLRRVAAPLAPSARLTVCPHFVAITASARRTSRAAPRYSSDWPLPVALRGVEVGDAGVEGGVDHGLGLLRVDRIPKLLQPRPTTETCELTEWAVLHGSNLSKSNTEVFTLGFPLIALSAVAARRVHRRRAPGTGDADRRQVAVPASAAPHRRGTPARRRARTGGCRPCGPRRSCSAR